MNVTTVEKICQHCQWCAKSGGITAYGEIIVDFFVCKRHPPSTDANSVNGWPRVHQSDFCGEFELSQKTRAKVLEQG
jgi:hypothetical protein